ncbi:hypothetical protein ACQUSR_27185 [Streptomyces sp. P1-3]|uniref:hypothetical protein n=1 Tax=Streptomyces sp. P1-3 TaxID=3421658 RepID=UPI003D36BB26
MIDIRTLERFARAATNQDTKGYVSPAKRGAQHITAALSIQNAVRNVTEPGRVPITGIRPPHSFGEYGGTRRTRLNTLA